MVLWFIMLTLAMELILCLIKLLYRGVSSLCGVLKKQDVVVCTLPSTSIHTPTEPPPLYQGVTGPGPQTHVTLSY